MLPYAFDPEGVKNDVGCCPGHDWPRTHRWAGTYSSPASKRASRKSYKIAKRNRRHRDKERTRKEANKELDNGEFTTNTP